MDFQLLIVLLCVLVALVFMGLRFWRVWRRRCACACGSDKPDPSNPVCEACMASGKIQDFRKKQ